MQLRNSILILLQLFLLANTISAQIDCVFSEVNYVTQSIITEMDSPDPIAKGDLDGDGDVDVIIGGYEKLYILSNNGRGGFDVLEYIDEGPENVEIFDFDNDGDNDIFLSENAKKIFWLENNGSGSFGARQEVFTPSSYNSWIVSSDLDANGFDDIVALDGSDGTTISIYTNNNGIFDPSPIELSDNGEEIFEIRLADIEGDGDIDIISSSETGSRISLHRNDGTGNFSPPETLIDNINQPKKFEFLDIENDGDLDLLVGSTLEFDIHLFLNDGSEQFTSHQVINDTPYRNMDIADVNNDGLADVVMIGRYDVAVFENDGTSNLADETVLSVGQFESLKEVMFIDVDLDGQQDFFVTDSWGDKVEIFRNESGMFNRRDIVSSPQLHYCWDMDVVDVDNNGTLDLIATSRGNDKISLYRNINNQYFDNQETILDIPDAYNRLSHTVTGDFNNDQYIDLLLNNSYDYSSIVLNDGLGNFIPSNTTTDSIDLDMYLSIEGDFNNDGKLDIAAFIRWGSDYFLKWYANNGSGTFNSGSLIEDGLANIIFLEANDFDNDGDLDIISVDGNKDLFIYENIGNGNFASSIQITSIGCKYATLTDMTGDGFKDLILVRDETLSYESIIILENQGDNSTYIPKDTIGENLDCGSFKIADLNQDGFKDIVATEEVISTSNIRVYLHDGINTYEENCYFNTNADHLELKDIDGDQDLDIIFSSRNDHALGWIYNLTNEPTISGTMYWDVNNNGQKDAPDREIRWSSSKLLEEDINHFVEQDGTFKYYVDPGSYTLTYKPLDHWILNTDSAVYHLDVVDGVSYPNNDFGFIPTDTIVEGDIHVSYGFPRCDQVMKVNISFNNQGTTILDGQLSIGILDQLTSFHSALNTPDNIGINSDGVTYWTWNFSDLYPNERIKKTIYLQLPGFNDPGFQLDYPFLLDVSSTVTVGNDPQEYVFDELFQDYISCAYDPNDKLVHPSGTGEENYTLHDETLTYTIRFQNTGNDTAFVVVVKDTLSDLLDPSSFTFIGSSHPLLLDIELESDKYLTFTFDGIILPDSTTNFEESQGYVSFSLNPISGLSDNTTIDNTGFIYFDTNPAIVTNTIQNTMVSCLPVPQYELVVNDEISSGETYYLPDGTAVNTVGSYETLLLDETGCDSILITTHLDLNTSNISLELQNKVIVYPNPTDDFFELVVDSNESEAIQFELVDIHGRIITTADIVDDVSRVDVSALPSSIYFIKIKFKGELLAIKKIAIR